MDRCHHQLKQSRWSKKWLKKKNKKEKSLEMSQNRWRRSNRLVRQIRESLFMPADRVVHARWQECSLPLTFVYGKAMTRFLKFIPTFLPTWLFSSLSFFPLLIQFINISHLTLYLPRNIPSSSMQEAAAHGARILMTLWAYAMTPFCLHLTCVSMKTLVSTTGVIQTHRITHQK